MDEEPPPKSRLEYLDEGIKHYQELVIVYQAVIKDLQKRRARVAKNIPEFS